ncbi:tRNA pseudouridine synthase A isoform X2 [Chrysoperla carnea]|nr:tRNA pseudouridine synthase A isoform X2 [Chrysoperla carnea]
MTDSATIEVKKPKYDGRIKKRKWEERVNSDESNEKKVCGDFERIKRRKYAMLIAYSGVNYFGMQRNPGMQTIEEELINALYKTKFITEEAFNQMQTIQFQRAARTDKGVSAARQVVSLKLPENIDVQKVNENLPADIRVFDLKRVTKGFNSKSQCDARSYIYVLPTFSFASIDNKMTVEDCSKYRITEDVLSKVNETLSLFIGTKNFHNFTSKKKFRDPSANRYIISFECSKPFVKEGAEFSVIHVKGQSFMLHQIRKMIGLALAVIRGLTTNETIERSWSEDRIDIPMAPGLGLVLDQVHYDRYNERYGKDGMHDTLDWKEVEQQIQEFKENYIYPNIISTEIKENSMYSWLETLPYHTYAVRNDDNREKNEDEDQQLSDDENINCKNSN